MSKRLTRNDWLDHGLKAMAEQGPGGLTVEALCERVQKTRGSFYHHFCSASDFQKQLLLWWQQSHTIDMIEKLERLGQSGQKLDHLNQLAAHLDSDTELAFRRLAASSSDAALTCQLVDRTRINYLASQYEQSPRYDADEAKMLARIEYAAWIGFQVIDPNAEPQEMLDMYQAFLKLTGRS